MNRPCLKSGEWNSRNLDKAKKKPILSRGFPKLKLFDDLRYFWTKFKWNVHSAKFARTVALAVGRGRYICCHCLCVLSMDGYISQGWDTSDTHISMTQLLTHSVAHSTKTNNQSIKKYFSLAVSWVKVVKNGKNSDF